MTGELIIRPNEPIDVLQYSGESIIAKEKANALVINSPQSEIQAVDLLKTIKELFKEADGLRAAKKEPFFEMSKRIDAAFKPVKDTLTEAESLVKTKLNAYLFALEVERQKEEAKKMKEFQDAQLKALEMRAFEDKEFDERTGEIFTPVVPEIVLQKTQSVGTYGAASQRSVWRWEVEDVKKMLLEDLIPDEKKLNALVKSGTRKRPGIRIYEDKTISVR